VFGCLVDKDELRLAKDEKDKDLNWVDIDLWRDKSNFQVAHSKSFARG
jgi:hypothetical protein